MPNRAAIVTGASRGIGRALAETLATEGYDLTITARKPDTLEEAAQHSSAGWSPRVELIAGNLTDEATIQEVVRTHKDRFRALGRARQQRRPRRGRCSGEQATKPASTHSSG